MGQKQEQVSVLSVPRTLFSQLIVVQNSSNYKPTIPLSSSGTSQDVVYASIADLTQSAATSSPLTHKVSAGQSL